MTLIAKDATIEKQELTWAFWGAGLSEVLHLWAWK